MKYLGIELEVNQAQLVESRQRQRMSRSIGQSLPRS
jgi:hypothetical protein